MRTLIATLTALMLLAATPVVAGGGENGESGLCSNQHYAVEFSYETPV